LIKLTKLTIAQAIPRSGIESSLQSSNVEPKAKSRLREQSSNVEPKAKSRLRDQSSNIEPKAKSRLRDQNPNAKLIFVIPSPSLLKARSHQCENGNG